MQSRKYTGCYHVFFPRERRNIECIVEHEMAYQEYTLCMVIISGGHPLPLEEFCEDRDDADGASPSSCLPRAPLRSASAFCATKPAISNNSLKRIVLKWMVSNALWVQLLSRLPLTRHYESHVGCSSRICICLVVRRISTLHACICVFGRSICQERSYVDQECYQQQQ